MKRAMILAGGTGGHIYPGLAIAYALKEQGVCVSWMGSQAKMAMEKELVPDCFKLYTIAVYQLRNKGKLAKLALPFQLTHAIWQAMRVLRKVKPDVCIAFGGFVAGPGGIAAKLLGIPLIVHEQNARAGLTNRYLAKIARLTFQAFPNTFSNSIKAITIGNPVRDAILALPEPQLRLAEHSGPLRVLVLGGSLGALAINEAVVSWLKTFERREEITVRHQTGKTHFARFDTLYKENGLHVDVRAYIDDMSAALMWADVVICRAGALTVSELAVVGVVGIFIPMPSAVDNHQFYNAHFLAQQDAAIIIEQKNLTQDALTQVITSFIEQRNRVLMMSCKARNMASRNTTQAMLQQFAAILEK